MAEDLVTNQPKALKIATFNRRQFNISHTPKWLCDVNTLQFTEVNDCAVKRYGYSRKEFFAYTIFDLSPREDHQKIRESLLNPLTVPGFNCTIRHIKKSGEIIPVEITIANIVHKGMQAILVTVINNIDEQLKTRETNKDLVQLYSTGSNKSNLYKWICDPDTGKIWEVNEKAIASYGYSKKEFFSMSVFDLQANEEEKDAKNYNKNDAGLKSKICYHHKKNGETIVVEIITHQINYFEKEAMLAIGVDITEKLEAEKKFIVAEADLRAILDNTNTAFYLLNTEFSILAFNQLAYDWTLAETGKKLKIGTSFMYYARKNRHEALLQVYNKVLAGQEMKMELKGYKNNKWYEVNLRRIVGNNKEMLGLCISSVDITEKKMAEEKLKNSEELYRSLFNKSPLPKWVADKDTLRFLEANEKAVHDYGYSRQEFLNMGVFDLRPADTHDELKKLIADNSVGKMKNRLVRHVKKNGDIIVVEISVHDIQYNGKEAYLGIAYELTKLLQLQQELADEKLQKQIGIIRATINGQEKERNELGKELHDNVNQILTSAKLYLESTNTMPDKQAQLIEMSQDLINSAINEIRVISKSLVPPSLRNLSLRDALNELEAMVRLTKKKIKIKLINFHETEISEELKISIYRIVQEQLNNILKHAEATEVIISIKQSDANLELMIVDNGKGFEVTKKRNGIGITNIINRAAIFSGKVMIDSSPGNGCRININFKLNHH